MSEMVIYQHEAGTPATVRMAEVAESAPPQKETIIRLIENMLARLL